ncbi:uncharacterized protein E5676_scaffold127G001210 [Cucumis melo var. makuwa]|uniref:CCHC-type domain-containing protein n=1 Tax=Cucumis melo var. makuwa TaxID=1194695 RepID=A0A5A7T4F4_CUCMM|nr:uncharacterized protein E6C27_scaffold36G00240 [Cucumis melo var. makuwa]TYK09819.1 uncharacterized protein E5676_scaffold127G001210 [Cucumis melo var. makuwa]
MGKPADAETFRDIFEDKYYPNTYCEAKRDEFLGLKQGSLSVPEYERKYMERSRYVDVIMVLRVTRVFEVVSSGGLHLRSAVRPQTGQESVASVVRCELWQKSSSQCLVSACVCYQCGQSKHFKRDCQQLRVAVQKDQGVESQTVKQPRVSTTEERLRGVQGRRELLEDLGSRERSML